MTNSAVNTGCNIRRTCLYVFSRSALTGRFCISALLFYSLIFCHGNSSAAACHPLHYHDRQEVTQVIDGDTVVLEDNRHIRLIGINTPEIDHENNSAEAGALEARDWLAGMLGNRTEVYLYYDAERYDRYKRTLAHVFLPDGRNVQQLILEKGLATPLTIPPNLAFVDCYQQAGNAAMEEGKGLWAFPAYAIVETNNIDPSQINGYITVSGQVTGINQFDRTTRVRLTGNLDLLIKNSSLRYFENINLGNLVGRRVRARGWLRMRKNIYQVRIYHPADLIVINEH